MLRASYILGCARMWF